MAATPSIGQAFPRSVLPTMRPRWSGRPVNVGNPWHVVGISCEMSTFYCVGPNHATARRADSQPRLPGFSPLIADAGSCPVRIASHPRGWVCSACGPGEESKEGVVFREGTIPLGPLGPPAPSCLCAQYLSLAGISKTNRYKLILLFVRSATPSCSYHSIVFLASPSLACYTHTRLPDTGTTTAVTL